MKTLALTLAAALVASTSAFAAENSYTNGNGNYANSGPVEETLFGGTVAGGLDMEPTASIDMIDTNHVFRTNDYINGRDAVITYTLNADGSRNVLSKEFRSSSR